MNMIIKYYFSRLLNVHTVSDLKQRELQTAEPLMPRPSRLEVEIDIAELKRCKSPDSDQILVELHQGGGGRFVFAMYTLNNYVGNKGELPDQ
jgi:hypothetical protein